MHLINSLDDYGKPAWITTMILGFILWWPLGLLVLAFLLGSGRMGHMGCARRGEWRQHLMQEAMRWRDGGMDMRRGRGGPFRPTGNAAFDDYRQETLKRLEEEADEFQTFLQRLRKAKDKAEFDQFMAERRGGGAPSAA